MLPYKVLRAQNLDSSVAEFILSHAEGLFRKDIGRVEIVAYLVNRKGFPVRGELVEP